MNPSPVNLRALPQALAALAVITAHGSAAAADYYGTGWYRQAEARLSYDANVSRAGAPGDIEKDFIAGIGAMVGYLWSIESNSQLSLSGRVAYERFDAFSDLNSIEAGAEVYYLIQPAPGYTAPWYEFSLVVSRIELDASSIRRGIIMNAGVRAGKRFTDAVTGQLGYDFSSRRSDGEVFDLDDHMLGLDLDVDLSSHMDAFVAYELHTGEVVSSAAATPWLHAAAKAFAPDPALDPHPGDGCERRCAFRLDALSHVLSAGFEFELTDHASLGLSARYFDTDWKSGGSYHGLSLGAGVYIGY